MGEEREGHILLIKLALLNLSEKLFRRNFFINAKGRVKEDGAFKFFRQESS